MKKRYLIIVLLLTIFLTACSKSKIQSVSMNELKEKINNKETFVLSISSTDDTLENTLNSILEQYDFKAYKINLNKLNDEENRYLKLQYDYTDPSIIFIIEGKDPTILSHIEDTSIRKNMLIERLKDMKFIKEDN